MCAVEREKSFTTSGPGDIDLLFTLHILCHKSMWDSAFFCSCDRCMLSLAQKLFSVYLSSTNCLQVTLTYFLHHKSDFTWTDVTLLPMELLIFWAFYIITMVVFAWVKVFLNLRIMRLTFHRKSASKSWIRLIIVASLSNQITLYISWGSTAIFLENQKEYNIMSLLNLLFVKQLL